MAKKIKVKAFTLVEICIAVSILGLLAGIIGWHLVKMADLQQFRKHVGLFMTNLQKLQVIALSRRCDLNVKIFQREGQCFYTTSSDEPLFLRGQSRDVLIKGVHSLSKNDSPVAEIDLIISSGGRIEPLEKIGFFLSHTQAGEAIWLDLSTPLQMKCSNEEPAIS